MLNRTFVHVEGIGYSTERRLWNHGADCWETFLRDPTAFRAPRVPLAKLLATVTQSQTALAAGNSRFFAERLHARDHWRGITEFGHRVAYLDIETDGGTDFDIITVFGVYVGVELRHFVRGEILLVFPEAMEIVSLLVTFYGSGFDVPVLRRAFPRLRFDMLHVDLCHTLKRVGLGGGLKKIERAMGIERSRETAGLDGWDAVRLWREYHRGSEEALAILLRYNEEDVRNLAPLLTYAYHELRKKLLEPDAEPARAD